MGVNIVFSVEPFDFWKSFYFVNAELFTFTDILTRNYSNLLICMYSKNIEIWLCPESKYRMHFFLKQTLTNAVINVTKKKKQQQPKNTYKTLMIIGGNHLITSKK